jgi:hypothetical protein
MIGASGISIFSSPSEGINLAHSQHISSTVSKSFNLSFIEDHNFTSGMGNWTNYPGSGTFYINGSELHVALPNDGLMYDPTQPTKDIIVTFDFQMPTSSNNASASFEIILRFNGIWGGGEAGATQYRVMFSACGTPQPFRGITIFKYIAGVLQTNWYFPTTYTDYIGQPTIWGNVSDNRIYNNTWMRATAGIIGNNIFVTWQNLSGNNTNTLRMAVMDNGTPITQGYIGFRSYHTLARLRNIMYYYPDINIPLRAGQSATVHFTSNYSGYSYSGTPLKGVLSNNNWTISTTNADIGVYSQYFTMTNSTISITQKVTLSVFPDVTVPGYWYDGPPSSAQWYPGNPVLPNQPGPMADQIYDPSVILDSDGYLKMWVSVNIPAVGQRTFFFESADGISWGTNGWANPLTNPPLDYQKLSVVKVNGIYEMLINTMDWSAGLFYFKSTNGIDWVIQNNGNPVLVPSLSWEDGAMSSPWVVYWGGQYYVTYSVGRSFGNIWEPFADAGAHGTSLLSLTKYPNPLRLSSYDSKGNFSKALGGVKPIRFGNSWIALTTGISAQGFSQTSLAMSDDFLNWTSYPDYVAFPRYVDPINQSWAYSHTYTGSIVVGYGGNNLGFWFNAHNGTNEQVGYVSWGFQMPPSYIHQTHLFLDLTILMFVIGIVVGVIAEGTNSLRKMQMRTTEQMVKSLLNMVIYIVIGIASLGILYSVVA